MDSNLENNLIKNLKLSLEDFKNQKNVTGEHWNYYYKDSAKFFDIKNLRNFRNQNLLANGLDDSLLFNKFTNKEEVIKNLIEEIGEDFFYKNLNKKNVGNCDSYISYKNNEIDFNDLLKMHWYRDLDSHIFNKSKINNICEIGGGYGNFARIILNNQDCKYFLIDLPQTNLMSSFYLQNNFENKKIYLYSDYKNESNNEISEENLNKFDIFILTPWCNLPKKLSIDLFINAKSMMEMNFGMITRYFKLIHEKTKINGFFLNINRYEKDSVGHPIRIHEYPYDNNWDVILSKQSVIQNKIHFLLTQRKYENIKNNIKSELGRIEKIAKIFYRKVSHFEAIQKNIKKLMSKYIKSF